MVGTVDDLPLFWSAQIIEHEETGCWLWIGANQGTDSYGSTYKGPAHKVVYEFLMGSIEPGLDLDHLCRIKPCVNPEHLELTTRSENVLRGKAPEVTKERHASVTHCPQRHEYTEDNTGYSNSGKYRVRYCRTCKREKNRLRRAK